MEANSDVPYTNILGVGVLFFLRSKRRDDVLLARESIRLGLVDSRSGSSFLFS